MENVINLFGNDYNLEDLSDDQRRLLSQVQDLESQLRNLEMQIEQRQVAHSGFVNALMKSFETEAEPEAEEVANG